MNRLITFMRQSTGAALALVLACTSISAQRKTNEAPSPEQLKELGKYPLNDFGEVYLRIQKEVVVPAPRHESRLLTLLPSSTVFYAALPNYGEAAKQALNIFRQERESRPELRKWWHSPEMAKNGPQFDMAVEAASNLSQYVGDEIVIAGSLNDSKSPSVVALAEVRKPGLKEALEFAVQVASAGGSKPSVRVLDKAGLASATETTPHQLTVLVRPDFVIAAPDLEAVRNFSRQLDMGRHEFASTDFGQRLQQNYGRGVAVMAGANLQTILSRAPIPAQQGQMLQQSGFSDMKYLVWEHRGLPGEPSSEGELSFTRPRRGIASWLATPRDLHSLDFASPKAILVASLGLKNVGEIFDDIQTLAGGSNPNAAAQLSMMQQAFASLKDDLLNQLGGEITLEIDNVDKDQPAWKAFLQVNDAARAQGALNRLLAGAPVQAQESNEDGVTYHSLTVPAQAKPMQIGYAFADGYLIIASSNQGVRDAVGLHRSGGSLAKSHAFLASLPPGHSTKASALYYQDVLKLMGMQLSRVSPELGSSLFRGAAASSPAVTCAYADETTIRGASMSQGVDVSTMLIAAAVAIPNLVRAKSTANESSAVANLRTMVTAQTMYAAAYPARGYSRDLARLGFDPINPQSASPLHAGFIDASLAKPTCTAGTWCEKSGYKFTFSPVCPRLLCQEFVAVATPVSASSGSRNFCVTSDGVIRFKVEEPLIAPLLASQCRAWQPVQ